MHETRALWIGLAIGGLSAHVHLLNLLALPALYGYAIGPSWRDGRLREERALWAGGLLLAAAGPALLALGQYLRFGDPFETGRLGIYSSFAAPWEALAAFLVAPGRSFLLYSPVLLLALFGLFRCARRSPLALGFAAAAIAPRLLFAAARSDWWGGWGVGSRHLVPLIPFAILPLAALFDSWKERARAQRAAIVVGVLLSVLLAGHLAMHSIWEWNFTLLRQPDPEGYVHRSHWAWSASPIVGFFRLPLDLLSFGALGMVGRGSPGPARIFLLVAGLGILGAGLVARRVSRNLSA